jgi:pimeloyl-ACP methyl ester carboxylesterase
MTDNPTTQLLDRPGGRIAFDVRGTGPLVVCVPGMGDLRSAYRFLAPVLAEAGYRVATMDLRGHGDSDATFDAYDDVAAGQDVLALVAHLGGAAVVIGNSMGAGAAAWAAAEQPEAVAALVLIGPFVREVPVAALKALLFRLALRDPWGRAVWPRVFRSLHRTPPADLDAHIARVAASLGRPSHWRAFQATSRTSHAPVEVRLPEISAPALVVMGDRDPDFPDPSAEARLVGDLLGADVVMAPGTGHYPMAETPEPVAGAILQFLDRHAPRA